MPFLTELKVKRHDAATWQLLEDLVYEGADQRFVVPAGYVTDFASSPNFIRWLIDDIGIYTLAAVVHDWLITDEIPGRRVTSRDTDGIFRRIMREEGVSAAKRWIMWTGVRYGALASEHRSYGRGFVRDLPMISLVSVLALPIVPATVLVILTRALVRPLRFIH